MSQSFWNEGPWLVIGFFSPKLLHLTMGLSDILSVYRRSFISNNLLVVSADLTMQRPWEV
jgi:hypothetical protein